MPINFLPIPEIILNKDEERFWASSVSVSNGCWIWLGTAHSNNDYGGFSLYGKTYLAHRISYKLSFEDPKDNLVLHKCNVPFYVNPSHLYLGTQADNAQQCAREGRRYVKGSFHPRSKLRDCDVLAIRALVVAGVSREAICKKFG